MKLNETAFAKAHGMLAGSAYLLCVVALFLAPGLTMYLFDTWFHGVDITALPVKIGPASAIIFGLVTFTAAGWLWGLLTARLYNKYAK